MKLTLDMLKEGDRFCYYTLDRGESLECFEYCGGNNLWYANDTFSKHLPVKEAGGHNKDIDEVINNYNDYQNKDAFHYWQVIYRPVPRGFLGLKKIWLGS